MVDKNDGVTIIVTILVFVFLVFILCIRCFRGHCICPPEDPYSTDEEEVDVEKGPRPPPRPSSPRPPGPRPPLPMPPPPRPYQPDDTFDIDQRASFRGGGMGPSPTSPRSRVDPGEFDVRTTGGGTVAPRGHSIQPQRPQDPGRSPNNGEFDIASPPPTRMEGGILREGVQSGGNNGNSRRAASHSRNVAFDAGSGTFDAVVDTGQSDGNDSGFDVASNRGSSMAVTQPGRAVVRGGRGGRSSRSRG